MAWMVRGAQGDSVRSVQGLLWQAGLYDGAIDGYFGRVTEKAVKEWQRNAQVIPDGMWGPKTQKASAELLGRLNHADALAAGNRPIVPFVGKRTLG